MLATQDDNTHRERPDLVITGMGAVSCLGIGCEVLWQGIEQGKDGLRSLERFDTDPFSVDLAGIVPGFERAPDPDREDPSESPVLAFAELAAREALTQANFPTEVGARGSLAIALGVSLGRRSRYLHRVAEILAQRLGTTGPCLTVGTACSASTNAMGVACSLLRRGVVDAVLAGGTAAVTVRTFAGFDALNALCETRCAPFSTPSGLTLAEGAGLVLLERAEDAAQRGASTRAKVYGFGMSGDAYHETTPDPSGAGVATAIQSTLRDSGLTPDQVGYVNAHGTGTTANDRTEWLAVRRAFGDHLPAISSSKGHLGHAQGAAGVLELITTVLALQRGLVPPTLRFSGPRIGGPSDPVGQVLPRPLPVSHGICLNAAFGGSNAAVLVGPVARNSPRRSPPAPADPAERLWVVGVGAVGSHGTGLPEFWRQLNDPNPDPGPVPDFSLRRIVRAANPRGLDPSTRFLIAAGALALQDANIRSDTALHEKAGLVVGGQRFSPTMADLFDQSIDSRGYGSASSKAFARLVPNAPAGSCSRALALKGPTLTLCNGPGAGLVAITTAADLLSCRDDWELMLAGGYDELPVSEQAPGLGEGAGCLVLARSQVPEVAAAGVCLAGWSMAGPGRASQAALGALSHAGIQPHQVDLLVSTQPPEQLREHMDESLAGTPMGCPQARFGYSAAAGSALTAVAAVLHTRAKGKAGGVVLVVDAEGDSSSTALVFRAMGGVENE